MANETLFLENLEEFIFDENKIVTYKWLSKSLAVHVNAAKQMLYTFVDHQRNKKEVDCLNVTYFVCGIKQDEDGKVSHHVQIVPEEKLSAVKSTYKTVTSCHVYSVQKAKLKDSNALFMVDYELLKKQIFNSNQYSAITCKLAKPRSQDDLSKLQASSVSTKQEEPASKSTTSSGKQSNGATQSKPKGLAGMFAKSSSKKTEEKKEEIKEEKESTEKKAADTKGKGKQPMSSFFGAGKKNKVAPAEPEKKVEAQPTKKSSTKEKKKETVKSKDTGNKQNKRESDDEEIVQSKKRRRIKAWESSSEEEDIDEPESPMPSPPREPSPTPMEVEPEEPVPVKEPSPVKPEVKEVPPGGKRRRVRKRKLVPKTYMDDDGYMVTEKAWESESTDASEVEEVAPPPKPKPQEKAPDKAPAKKKPSPSKNSKQTSLMNFFGKK